MPDINDKISQFMSASHGGNPTHRFNNIMGQANLAEQYNRMSGNADFSAFEQQAGFGSDYNENYQPQYPPAMRQQQNPYNNQYQAYPPQRQQQYPPQYQPQVTASRRALSNLPQEILESLEKTPIDSSVFDVHLSDNTKSGYIKENTRMDLFQDTPNPWNPRQPQIMQEQQQYQTNVVPQGIPIQQPMMNYPSAINNNAILEKLVENISIINKKLGIEESVERKKAENMTTLFINGEYHTGVIKQQKNNEKLILFLLDDGKNAFILTPSSKKPLKK